MMNAVKVAISSGFLTAFAVLPRNVQSKVTEFVNKFRNNPLSAGINYEKLKYITDEKICSVRIDNDHSGIVAREEKSGVYLLLWVDRHDEAYKWCRNKRCEVNPKNGAVQIFDVVEVPAKVEERNVVGLFDKISDDDLMQLGLPEKQLPFIRTIISTEDFYSRCADSLPSDAYENLTWLAEGFTVKDVLELLESEDKAGTETPPVDLSSALDNLQSQRSFVVIEGEDELLKIMAEPLEKWRIFLHPTQRKIVTVKSHGPVRVLGGAGTGKTVVAMHRARYLASKCSGTNEKILFTTFTANLAGDIRENLRKLCSTDEFRRIDVVNIDSWVVNFLRAQGYGAEVIYGKKVTDLWNEAILRADPGLGFEADFYEDEWNRIIVAQEAFTLPLYKKAVRTGRGTRLDRKKRVQVWKVVEAYLNLMKENQVRDINMAMYECRMLLSNMNQDYQYKHIVIDEGQDFSANALKLLREMAGEEHDDDLLIAGDAHQRIYKNKPVLSQCGINIRGAARSKTLKINYRTTEEIRKAAFAVLKGISFDGMDGNEDIDKGDKCQSLTHGNFPVVKEFRDAASEMEYLVAEIQKMIKDGILTRDICVVARTHRLLDAYASKFNQSGIKVFEIKMDRPDLRDIQGLRMATMHRVKGLEFPYVFIVAANKGILPLDAAIDHTDNVTEQESITSEKCLLYVAMSRAQKSVTITSYGGISEFLAKENRP